MRDYLLREALSSIYLSESLNKEKLNNGKWS